MLQQQFHNHRFMFFTSPMKILLSCLLLLSCIHTCFSDGVFTSHLLTGRTLLQAKTPCPVNFEFMNYTIITSRCKGPQYPVDICCQAFKDLACPYNDELNDLSNDCSSTMFSYINLYGSYPPGLFSSLCHDDKVGLICPASAPGAQDNTNNGNVIHSSVLFTFAVGCLILLFW